MHYQQKINVEFDFDVVFTRDVFSPENEALADMLSGENCRCLAFIDQGVVENFHRLKERIQNWFENAGPRFCLAALPRTVQGGEEVKNSLDILDVVGRAACEAGLCRHSYILIIGGGAVLDAVGFAASIIHRGIRQIRIPTTVLSQNDSGVGVKNGLNRFGMKNFYGSFQPPDGVIIDSNFLQTLPDRHWRGGAAEAFKVAAIKDREFLRYLIKNAPRIKERDREVMEYIIRECALLHLEHITEGGDPFERGSERPLDFGHWASHWLETATDYRLSHGEAVAIGMAIDLHIAFLLGLIEQGAMEEMLSALKAAGLRLWHEKLEIADAKGRPDVMEGLEQFRQHLGGRLTVAMPMGPGEKRNVNAIEENHVRMALEYLQNWG